MLKITDSITGNVVYTPAFEAEAVNYHEDPEQPGISSNSVQTSDKLGFDEEWSYDGCYPHRILHVETV